eukprot:CAMPEP_0168352526 /NCGR_PEP_ID=MMETSP0213-20121227/22640_1 /TAXON_ID=151035 /ORGANISM="Euplotes harpa, Strain FSP1.4" /LENGTH=520 /DNA_ID=CAMNT_0008363827 /DNA_START=173 /DNA_END=1731 /DNA_ORIENTATION=+
MEWTVSKFVSYTMFDEAQGNSIAKAYVKMMMRNLSMKTFEPEYFCEVLLQVCSHENYSVRYSDEDVSRILSDKPSFIQNNDFVNNLYKEIEDDTKRGVKRETMLMYHFSDLHFDLEYKAGSNIECGEIVCCNPKAGPAPSPDKAAGKWGDYKCDTNPELFHQLVYSLNLTGQPDFIIWTGDSVRHEIEQDPAVTTNATIYITELVENHSPKSVVFPIQGNHEFNPMNIQDFDKKGDPVIELISNSWRNWLTPEVKEEYSSKTYYSYLARTHPAASVDFERKIDKTRIIALNTQNCYFFNFENIKQHSDPGNELEWLENLLRQMEKNGEVGIIVGHISPGVADCITSISTRFRALMERYQHVIRINLFGHTHNEEFEVVRSKDGKAINVNHLAPSFTTFTGHNPSFRAITLDVKTKLPVKIETYTLNMRKANLNDEDAKFLFAHELAAEYNLHDLSPNSFLNLTSRFRTDEAIALKYENNKSARGVASPVSNGCDDECRKALACHTSNSVYADARECYSWT